MKKTIKSLLILLILIFTLTFSLSQTNQVNAADDTITVTFYGKDGTVIDTITCDTTPCDITSLIPDDPADVGNTHFLRWSVFDFSNITEDTEVQAIYNLNNQIISIDNVPLIGQLSVQAYAFFIVMGIIVAVFLAMRESPRVGLKKDDFLDGFLWIAPVAIIGARLWYVIYEWDRFIYGNIGDSLMRIIGFSNSGSGWEFVGLAGLAIHGAFITAVILAYFFTRKREMDLFKLLDIVAVGFIIAQAFGRWGNFFNQEAHGGLVGGLTNGVMNLSLEEQYDYLRNTLHIPEFIVNNMYIERATNALAQEPVSGFYHPTFFYESMLNLLGFSIMLVLRRYKKIHFGEIFAFYLVWYGVVRGFIIEPIRTDPLVFELFGISMKTAIVTSVIMIAGGVMLSVFVRLKRKEETYAKSLHTFNF